MRTVRVALVLKKRKGLAVKTLVAALVIVLLAGTTALAYPWAGVPVVPAPATYYVPSPVVVQAYYPPVYAAPAPVYAVPAPVVVARPYLVAAPVVSPLPVAVPAPVYYGRPVVVHPKVYVPGQPVRNVLRAVTP
jgi:hypothetical protein